MKIAVLMGGWSSERAVSLVTGQAVITGLKNLGHEIIPIDVQKNISFLLEHLTPLPDLVFNALHGTGGEDGCIPAFLEILEIPYTHSGVCASAVAMNKTLTKTILRTAGVLCPNSFFGTKSEILAHQNFPFVVKPNADGSSVHVYIIKGPDDFSALENLPDHQKFIVEDYIPGRELTVSVLWTKSGYQALGVTELCPKQGFYDYAAKYTEGKTVHTLPADIPTNVTREAKRIALLAHEILDCKGVSRTDFRYDEDGDGLFFLEINTHPGMTPLSLVPEQAAYAALSFEGLLSNIIEDAA